MPRCRDLFLALGAAALLTASVAGPAFSVADRRDGQVMLRALNDLMSFAAPGRLVRYDNPVTGNHGSVTALRQFSEGGKLCWDYSRSYYQSGASGPEMIVNGTACELERGLWTVSREGPARPKSGGSAWSDPGSQAAQPAPAPAATAAVAPARSGYDRGMVRETQQLLTDLGYRPGPVDGVFGRKTGAAISSYQSTAGLSVTGEPSQALLDSLRASKGAMGGAGSEAASAPAPSPAPAAAVQPAPSPTPAPAPSPSGGTTAATGGWQNPDAPSAPATATPSPAPTVIPPPPPPPPPVPQ